MVEPWQYDEDFDAAGYDSGGYAADGYASAGYDSGGYAADGYGPDGHRTDGYGRAGHPAADTGADPWAVDPWRDGDPADARPWRAEIPTDGRPDPMSGDQTPVPTGRHRGPRRWPVPVGLAGVVAVLLLMLGVGAALLPANFSGDSNTGDTAPAGAIGEQAQPAGDGGQDVLAEEPGDAASPTPGAATPSPPPSATKPAKPSRSKVRQASPTPDRTRERTTSAPAAPAGDSREEQVLSLVNQERAAAGCGALRVNSALATAARLHSQDQADTNNMSHTGSDGSSPSERAQRAGYSGGGVGENVAFGYATPAAVMEGWMNSPGHRQNILNCGYRVIGIGVAAADNGRLYWTQMFGTAG